MVEGVLCILRDPISIMWAGKFVFDEAPTPTWAICTHLNSYWGDLKPRITISEGLLLKSDSWPSRNLTEDAHS